MVAARHQLHQAFGMLADSPAGLERTVTGPLTEGLNGLLGSFYTLYHQYQKHHWVVEGTEFGPLHRLFEDYAAQVRGAAEAAGERLDDLGGVPAATPVRLQQLACFQPEVEDVFDCRTMLTNDLAAEQACVQLLRRLIAAAGSLGDPATEFFLRRVLLGSEQRAFHLAHYLADDSLALALPPDGAPQERL
ncbi:Dps family protein [Gloeobacter morelensis]|uniref:DNA starvation/stationary phase protection protein n=1 Tax=Gloeobacter morelensis MG652769 TaxID=2781736 RepID=A0ABY3PM38_9CYAN|nr:DNA starvation/stationary phase protection protein [Gloeobacter morelensis]UFP94757.1 DNA starvation/stationary phase protection protein [Gloeobacter morelensis MG652769]